MEKVGEVVIVQPGILIAQGERKKLPSIGSVLKTDNAVFCIVASHSIDNRIPGRVPTAYGKPINVLEQEQPQVFALMKWMFQLIPFGAKNGSEIMISYPKDAVEIHSLLSYATDDEVFKTMADLTLLDFLFGIDKNAFPQRDEVVINFLDAYLKKFDGDPMKNEYIRIFSHLAIVLKDDYFTLKKIMDRVRI